MCSPLQLQALAACLDVGRAVVEAMLEAANWAPTHGKTEPWRFVVLGRQSQEEMIDLTLKVLFPGYWHLRYCGP